MTHIGMTGNFQTDDFPCSAVAGDATRLSRREWLRTGMALSAGLSIPQWRAQFSSGAEGAAPPRRPRIAAIFSILRFRSHAFNILENFFQPYLFNGKLVDPGVDVVSFYADQFPSDDMAREASRRLGVPLYSSIADALTLGGKELAVDGVLSIVEHGDYPLNERGQTMYPRKEFFDQSLAVMKQSNRFVPFFNDKHLSYRADWGQAMYDASRQHGFGLMAGSSVPLSQRVPNFELPRGAEIEEALTIHGGGVEVYGYHGLEVLQAVVEGRRGGETGIAEVELVAKERFTAGREMGRWSKLLVDAALKAEGAGNFRRQGWPIRPAAKGDSATTKQKQQAKQIGEHAICVRYRDGLRGTVLRLAGGSADRWLFACKLKGEKQPIAFAHFNSPWGNRGLFKALSHSIQHMFKTGKAPYPVERTLLAGAAIDAALISLERGRKSVTTPYLNVAYQPVDFQAFRETGATWKKITVDVKQPTTFTPGDAPLLGASGKQ